MLRKRITAVGLAAISLSAMALPALADGDPKSFAPPVEERSRWSGFYLGVGGGAGKVERGASGEASKYTETDVYKKKSKREWVCEDHDKPSTHSYSWNPPKKCDWKTVHYYEYIDTLFGGFTEAANLVQDDWQGFGTIQFGADHLFHDRFLVGLFADVDLYRNADSSFFGYDDKLALTNKFELNRVWNVGGRVGFLLHPELLLYGVGGYTQADVEDSTDIDFKHGPTLSLSNTDKLKGYFVGGGGEWQFHKNIGLKVEYRYAKYRSEGDSASATGYDVDYYHDYKFETSKYYSAKADYDADIHSVRGVLVFRFDEPDAAPVPLK
jgi:opacity protein-like surface antigen